MKLGNIPENLTIFIREETENTWTWKDVDAGKRLTKVRPCYISDATNKKTLESGETWAKGWGSNGLPFSKLDVLNEPFRLKIVTLEIRDEGGRAYKVCAEIGNFKNLFFDLREDVLLDCIFEIGIKKGGEINADFIFARIGSEMKPIRVGSLLHDKMIEATNFNKKEKCELVIGGMYSNKKGDKFVYLGQFYSRPVEVKKTSLYGHRLEYEVKVAESQLYHVFNNSYFLRRESLKDKWFENDIPFHFVKKPTFKIMDGVIEIPSDYIQSVKNKLDGKLCDGNSEYYGMTMNMSSESGYVHPKLEMYLPK
jgi:hypothetical protein